MSTPVPIPDQSYSTILNCREGALVCLLRALQGIICCFMSYYFVKGYMKMSKRRLITNEDKEIYLLSLSQIVLLAVYYLLFEQFFLLATIRNLLVWTNLTILAILCQIQYSNNQLALKRCNILIMLFRFGNFVLWLKIALVEGTTITNTSFNVGYNCLIPDWIVLSGCLLGVSLLCGFVGMQIIDRFNWEIAHKNKEKQLSSPKETILIFMGTTIVSSFMMFVWDFVAHMNSSTEQDCVDMFMGNNFPRKILFFLLKIITMQIQPLGIYYTTYYKAVRDNPNDEQEEIGDLNEIQYLADDTASMLNTSLISRGSTSSLHSSNSRDKL